MDGEREEYEREDEEELLKVTGSRIKIMPEYIQAILDEYEFDDRITSSMYHVDLVDLSSGLDSREWRGSRSTWCSQYLYSVNLLLLLSSLDIFRSR